MKKTLIQIKKVRLSYFETFLVVVFGLVLLLLSSHLWNGDILFHTDLARDFLVLEELIETKNPTLIGPRSGGIPGVFHGPLWYYLSLIPFVLSKGDPVIMGWFWWLLGVISSLVLLTLTYKLTKNLTISILVAIGFSLKLLPLATSPVNNYMADLFSFLVFAVWLAWLQKPSLKLAMAGWFGLGLLVQFQMAFAVPIALVWFPVFLFYLYRNKKYQHLLSVILFVPPILSFIFFEVRHDFLQTRSVLSYLQLEKSGELSLIERLLQRLLSAFGDGLNIYSLPAFFAPIITGIFCWFGLKTKNKLVKNAITLFTVWYVGWWILACLFSGTIWIYYFSPFFGILFLCIGLISSQSKIPKYLFITLILWLFLQSRSTFLYTETRFDGSSWKLLSRIAEQSLSKPDRGYFVYSQDQFAYSLKYAFSYYAKTHPEVNAKSFEKRSETVLVKAADDPRNPYSTSQDWQSNKIKISEQPIETISFPFGYVMEVYNLSEETINKPVDPNLIIDLHFR